MPALLESTIHNYRAACFLKLGKDVEARAAARKALALDTSNKKALFRLGSAQLALGKHHEAMAVFARLAKDATAGNDVRTALARANRRLAESHGDFRESAACLEFGKPHADATNYVGPLEVKMAGKGRGRGLFLTEGVAAGTLLLAEKALVAEAADASHAHFGVDNIKSKLYERSQDAVLQQALQQALACPLTNARLHSLYDGSRASASRIPSMKLFRTDDPEDFNADDHVLDQPPVAVDQVRSIVQYNTFGFGEATSGGETGTWLWVLTSFINHARNPNTARAHVGDVLLVKGAKPLMRGDEITTTLLHGVSEEERKEKLQQGWGIVEERL